MQITLMVALNSSLLCAYKSGIYRLHISLWTPWWRDRNGYVRVTELLTLLNTYLLDI